MREPVREVQYLNNKNLGEKKRMGGGEGKYEGNNSRKFPRNEAREISDWKVSLST